MCLGRALVHHRDSDITRYDNQTRWKGMQFLLGAGSAGAISAELRITQIVVQNAT